MSETGSANEEERAVFAFLFDEDHPESDVVCGPQFAAKIIAPIEKMNPVPQTRVLRGGLVHNTMVYQVDRVVLGEKEAHGSRPPGGRIDRAQHSSPNYDRRLSIVSDLAETLSVGQSSFSEEEIWEHLARKNIWAIVTPTLSTPQAQAIHRSIVGFGPYLGYAQIDLGNPLHRRLFLQSLFNDLAVGPSGLAFRRDLIDEEDDLHFESEYGATRTTTYPAEEFDALFPAVQIPSTSSNRGELTAKRLAGNDPGHRARVARELIDFKTKTPAHQFSFSARRPNDGIEFVLPPEKFTNYLLKIDHKDGGPKARFFIENLGIDPADWRYLADQILQGAKAGALYRVSVSEYGASHGILVLVTGRNQKVAVVETGWRVPEEGPALFVTAYPAEEKRGAGLTANSSRVPPQSVGGNDRWLAIHDAAHSAGVVAGARIIPTPMVLRDYGAIWEGECGFAWTRLADARSSFARWILSQGHGHRSDPGVSISANVPTQSMAKKQAYAEAYAEVLRSNGIDCVVETRLD